MDEKNVEKITIESSCGKSKRIKKKKNLQEFWKDSQIFFLLFSQSF